jgi:hypothetical protein
LRLAIPKELWKVKTDPAPTTEIQLHVLDGKRHYGKKTLKSPKLLLNTAWVNSVWDTKRINQSGRDVWPMGETIAR